jgi:hypothetical protein
MGLPPQMAGVRPTLPSLGGGAACADCTALCILSYIRAESAAGVVSL